MKRLMPMDIIGTTAYSEVRVSHNGEEPMCAGKRFHDPGAHARSRINGPDLAVSDYNLFVGNGLFSQAMVNGDIIMVDLKAAALDFLSRAFCIQWG